MCVDGWFFKIWLYVKEQSTEHQGWVIDNYIVRSATLYVIVQLKANIALAHLRLT